MCSPIREVFPEKIENILVLVTSNVHFDINNIYKEI